MTVTLSAHLEDWIAARVAVGEFASVEEGVRRLIEERIVERSFEPRDDDWAQPYLDEGLAAFERGDFITLEEHRSRVAARLAALRPA